MSLKLLLAPEKYIKYFTTKNPNKLPSFDFRLKTVSSAAKEVSLTNKINAKAIQVTPERNERTKPSLRRELLSKAGEFPLELILFGMDTIGTSFEEFFGTNS